MSRIKNGFTLSSVDDPENWASVETNAWDEVHDFLPDKGEYLTDRHHHSALYTSEDEPILSLDEDGMVSIAPGSSGALDPYGNTYLVLENDGDIFMSFMVPDDSLAGIYFANGDFENNTMWMLFGTPPDNANYLSFGSPGFPGVLYINEQGVVIVGGASHNTRDAAFEIYQVQSAAAIPCLELNQADEDQPFINFSGTSAADSTKSLSTGSMDGLTYIGRIRVKVNGASGDRGYWIPYYDDEFPE